MTRRRHGSVRAWQPKHVLPDESEHEVVRDGRDPVQPRLAELPLDVVLGREAEAAVRVEADVRRLPGGFGRQVAWRGWPRRRTASPRRTARPPGTASGRQPRPRRRPSRSGTARPGWRRSAGRRRRARLAYCDRPLDEPAAVADALGGDQDALGVHTVEDVPEPACPPRRPARSPGSRQPSKKISVVAWFIIVLIGVIFMPGRPQPSCRR